MSSRELIALGTSSQVPTRERSHNAYLLRWDGEGYIFDPGEGAQRQLTLAGVPVSAVHHICITHFHGDHCLGLAGIVQRLSLDQCGHPVHLYYPESGQVYVDRLCSATVYQPQVELVFHPVPETQGTIELTRSGETSLEAHALDHSIPTIGFRVTEAAGIRFLKEKLESAGIAGPTVGDLKKMGFVETRSGIVRLEDVTTARPGSSFAFVMDTRPCAGALSLAKGADLIVMEATYTSEHQDLANFYRHSTAADAAKTAQKAGARKLALTHFSQRYPNPEQHLADARRIFPDVLALNDLDRVEITRRH